MKYLVTGTGLVGAGLITELAREHEVVALDIKAPASELPAQLILGDIRDPGLVADAAAGVDGIFHTAALHGIHTNTHTPTDFMTINTVGTFNVLEAAVRQGVPKVVLSSSTAALSTRDMPATGPIPMTTDDDARRFGDVYGMTKVFGEMMLEHYRDRHGLSVVALRYGGIRQLVAQIFGMTMTWATSGQLTDLRDALSANLLAMQSELPRLSYLVLPTTVLDPTSLARHDWQPKPALLEALPWLTSDDVPDDLPRPRALFDASVIESDLGLKFQASQEDFIREALVGSVEPVGAA